VEPGGNYRETRLLLALRGSGYTNTRRDICDGVDAERRSRRQTGRSPSTVGAEMEPTPNPGDTIDKKAAAAGRLRLTAGEQFDHRVLASTWRGVDGACRGVRRRTASWSTTGKVGIVAESQRRR